MRYAPAAFPSRSPPVAKKNRSKIAAEPQASAAPAARPQPPRRPLSVEPEDGWAFLDDAVALGLGLLCFLLPIAVTPGIRDLFQLPKQLMMAEAAAWFIALFALLALIGRPLRWPRTPLLWPGLALVASVLLGVAIAPEQTGGILSLFAKTDLHRWLAAAVLFAVTILGVTSPRRFWYVAVGLLLGGLYVALVGIGEQHDIQALLPQAWLEHKVAIISKPGSTFGNRNMAAELIVAVMPASYAVMAMAARWWGQHKTWQALLALAFGASAFVILLYYLKLTVTRSAFVGAFLGLVVAGTAWMVGRVLAEKRRAAAEAAEASEAAASGAAPEAPRRSRLMPLVVGLTLAAVAVAATSAYLVRSGFNTPIDEADQKRAQSMSELVKSSFDTEGNAAQWRFGMWASTWKAIEAHPFGQGAGNWRVLYPQYVTQRTQNEMFSIAKQPIRAHQDFLQFASEFGLQGLAALLALIGLAFWLTARAASRYGEAVQGDADGAAWLAFGAASSLAAIFAICGDAMFSFPLALPAPTFLFALHLGVIGSAEIWLTRPEEWAKRSTVPTWGKIALVASAVVSIATLQNLHERWMVAERGFTDGRAMQKRGRASEGLVAIREAIAVNPDDFQNHFIEALCLNSLGRTREAIDSLQRSLVLYPNLLNAWVNVAMFSAKIGDYDGMNKAIDTALKLKPDEIVALNVRANWLAQHGKQEEILKILGPHAKTYPDNLQMLGHLANAAQKLGQHAQEATYREMMVAVQPRNIGYLENLAEALTAAGKHAEAVPHIQLAAELAGQARADLKRQFALALAQVGEYQKAAHEASVAIDLDHGEQARILEGLEKIASAKPGDAGLTKLIADVRQVP